jgi:hypothetical protein
MRHLLIALLAVHGSTALAADSRIAVMPTQFDETSRGRISSIIDEVILAAVQAVGGIEVIGQDDVNAMLGFEMQKDLAGCDDAACFAQIGGALGVDRIAVFKVGAVTNEWLVTAKLINIRSAKVETRITHFVSGTDKQLFEALPSVVRKLFGLEALAPPPAPAVAAPPPPAVEPAAPSPTPALAAPAPASPVPAAVAPAEGHAARGKRLLLLVERDLVRDGMVPTLELDFPVTAIVDVAMALIAAWPVGTRVEVRFMPISLWRLRPYAGGGVSYFPADSIGLRLAAGGRLDLGAFSLALAFAYERYVSNESSFYEDALVGSVGIGFGS